MGKKQVKLPVAAMMEAWGFKVVDKMRHCTSKEGLAWYSDLRCAGGPQAAFLEAAKTQDLTGMLNFSYIMWVCAHKEVQALSQEMADTVDYRIYLHDLALVYQFGRTKYTEESWKYVSKQASIDSAMRHFIMAGAERDDPESGLPHLSHLFANCAILFINSQEGRV